MDVLKLRLDVAEDVSMDEEVLETTLSMTSRWAAPSLHFFPHHRKDHALLKLRSGGEGLKQLNKVHWRNSYRHDTLGLQNSLPSYIIWQHFNRDHRFMQIIGKSRVISKKIEENQNTLWMVEIREPDFSGISVLSLLKVHPTVISSPSEEEETHQLTGWWTSSFQTHHLMAKRCPPPS